MLIGSVWSLDSKTELTNGINLKVLVIGMVKIGGGQSCDGTLKLAVSEEWTGGINWFFLHVDTVAQKLKAYQNFFWVGIVKNGCGQSAHGSL